MLKRRTGGLTLALLVDVLAAARRTREWALLVILVAAAAALVLGTTAQYTVPWVVYGGL